MLNSLASTISAIIFGYYDIAQNFLEIGQMLNMRASSTETIKQLTTGDLMNGIEHLFIKNIEYYSKYYVDVEPLRDKIKFDFKLIQTSPHLKENFDEKTTYKSCFWKYMILMRIIGEVIIYISSLSSHNDNESMIGQQLKCSVLNKVMDHQKIIICRIDTLPDKPVGIYILDQFIIYLKTKLWYLQEQYVKIVEHAEVKDNNAATTTTNFKITQRIKLDFIHYNNLSLFNILLKDACVSL